MLDAPRATSSVPGATIPLFSDPVATPAVVCETYTFLRKHGIEGRSNPSIGLIPP